MKILPQTNQRKGKEMCVNKKGVIYKKKQEKSFQSRGLTDQLILDYLCKTLGKDDTFLINVRMR